MALLFPHMVYEIYYHPPPGLSSTLKYGISYITKNIYDRPENQIQKLKSIYGAPVNWKLKLFVPNNGAARGAEKLFVNTHILIWGICPQGIN